LSAQGERLESPVSVMKSFTILWFCAAVLGGALADANGRKGTPIDKVIILMEKLQGDIEKDGKSEQASYDNYACWVESTLRRKATDISKAKETIEQLNLSIKKAKAEIASHGAEIAQLKKDIAQNNEAVKDAKALRDKENSEYAQERTESEQCIGAMEAAIKVLTGAGAKKAFLQQAKLMSIAVGVRQVMNLPGTRRKLSDTDFQVVTHFLNKPEEFASTGLIATQTGQNPFGDYAPQSTQIQGILKGMYDGFTADLEKDNAEEANKQKSFEEIFGTKMQELKTLEATLETQETDMARKTKQLAEDEVLRDDTTEQLATDEAFFEDTKEAAETKAKEWSVRTRLRTEELAGIQGAVQILKGGSETFKNATSTMFVQLRSVREHSNIHEEAVNKLRDLAAKYQSANLRKLMATMKSGGHFDKVMVMIDQMISLLRKEEQEDIEHRDRCENGQNANTNELEDLSADIATADKKLKHLSNTKKDLNGKLDTTNDDIKDTNKDMAEMLDQRNKDHAEFEHALKMDADAVSVIKMAIVRISKYYKENGMKLQLVQSPEYSQDPDKAPETTFSGADAHQSESTGIVGILDMIQEDLTKEMAEGRADEAKAQAEYEKQSGALQASLDAQKETKASLEKEIAGVEDSEATTEKRKDEKKDDKDSEEDMKKALKSDCNWVKTHFESRRTKRKSEIDGLVEAKNFLAGVEDGDAVLPPGF